MADTQRVKDIIHFIQHFLKIPSGKGEGGPFRLRKFQKDFIRDVYGRTRGEKRVVRRAILCMGRPAPSVP